MPRREITRPLDEIRVKSTASTLAGARMPGPAGGHPGQIRNSCSIVGQAAESRSGSCCLREANVQRRRSAAAKQRSSLAVRWNDGLDYPSCRCPAFTATA